MTARIDANSWIPEDSRPWRLAIVGLGGVFRASHCPAILKLIEEGWPIEVSVLCDRDEACLQSAASHFPQASLESDVSVIDPSTVSDLDGVLVLTKAHATPSICRRVFSWERPVFVEKPVAESLDDLQALDALARKTGLWVQVGYNRRFHPAMEAFKSELAELGELLLVRSTMARRERSERDFYADTLVHSINALQYLFGDLSLRTSLVHGRVGTHGIPMLMKCVLESSLAPEVEVVSLPHCGRSRETIEVFGEQGTMELGFLSNGASDPAQLAVWRNGVRDLRFELGDGEGPASRLFAQGFLDQLKGFLLDSRAGSDPKCSLSQAMDTSSVLQDCLSKGGLMR